MLSAPARRGGAPFNRYAFQLWTRSPRGRRQLQLEERELKRVLPDLFGRYCVQVGSWGAAGRMLAASATLHRLVLGSVRESGAQVLCEPEHLPLPARCADAALLPHCLEFTPSPHQLLREVNRVLTDRGTLLILGYSPFSLWSLRRFVGLRYRAFPEGARFLPAGRLCDWLELLDFEVTEVRRFGSGFPWRSTRSDGFFGRFADTYLLVARKRVLPMTLVGRPQRAAVRPLIGAAVPEARRTPSAPAAPLALPPQGGATQ